MFVPGPRGYDKKITLLPFEPLTIDDRLALSIKYMVYRAVHLPERSGVFYPALD
jgi:hypothetical protein